MIVYNHPTVTRFVLDMTEEEDFGEHVNIGFVRDNKLLAGCVIGWWTGVNAQMYIAGRGLWCKREFLEACFDVAFNKLGCRRVTGTVDSENAKAVKLNQHLGFKEEGRLRQATEEGHDMIMFGMLREECRFV